MSTYLNKVYTNNDLIVKYYSCWYRHGVFHFYKIIRCIQTDFILNNIKIEKTALIKL